MIRSRTISGILCLAAVCAPLAIAPFRVEQSLGFVREIENRNPDAFPPFDSGTNLIDAMWWARVSRAIEDRVPFRRQAVELQNSMRWGISDEDRSDEIAKGLNGWLFLRLSLGSDYIKPGRIETALQTLDAFMNHPDRSAAVYFLAPPDKASLYPEQLDGEAHEQFKQSLPMRNLLHDWFAQPGHPERIDLYRPMLELKDRSEGPIYNPQSSHCTSPTSMLIARAMVSTDAPELWDESLILTRERGTRLPELARIAGDLRYSETIVDAFVRRPGVRCTSLWKNGEPVEQINYRRIAKFTGYNDLHTINQSAKLPMIAGKTLVIHDSFVTWYLMPTLTQFYEDIRFVHYRILTEEIIREAMTSYDRIYIESVERHFAGRLQHHLGSIIEN